MPVTSTVVIDNQTVTTHEGERLEEASIQDVLLQLGYDEKETEADGLPMWRKGLSDAEAAERLSLYGKNSLPQKHISKLRVYFGYMWNPLSWTMEAAAFTALVLTAVGGDTPDWEDFIGIVILLFCNATLAYIEESQAGEAVKALVNMLSQKACVIRSGKDIEIGAEDVVLGDVIELRLGDAIPADARVLRSNAASVDQAALTGESLPVSKEEGDVVYSGTTVKQGHMKAVVIATGTNTFFGRAAVLVSSTSRQGHFHVVLANIGFFCLGLIGFFLLALLVTMYPVLHYSYVRGMRNVVVILIGGIPIAMPTVLSVALAIGSHQLAEKKAIVTRMTAIEELAAVDVLCTDKTGTLTLNQLSVDKSLIRMIDESSTPEQCLEYAALASFRRRPDAIDRVVINSLGEENVDEVFKKVDVLHFVPFNPVIKRTEVTFRHNERDCVCTVMKGLPSMLVEITRVAPSIAKKVNDIATEYAARGFRTIAVVAAENTPVYMSPRRRSVDLSASQAPDPFNSDGSIKPEAVQWKFIGMIPMFDPPRTDTAETIRRLQHLGVNVKMLTGDAVEIAKETARQLDMGAVIYKGSILSLNQGQIIAQTGATTLSEMVERADGFSGVFPEHKYAIVKLLQQAGHTVAMTGDGVNDAPALKVSDVGVAVAGAADAARGASDVVLVEDGLSVIADAVITSRKIFQRMKSYALYACSTTVRIVVGFSVLIWMFEFDMPPFLVLIMAVLNDGTITTISHDTVSPSDTPDKWKLRRLFGRSIVLGAVQALSTIMFVEVAFNTDWFGDKFNVDMPWRVSRDANDRMLHAIVYLQSSIIGQASIFVCRVSNGKISFLTKPSKMLMAAFVLAQLVSTFIAVYANWNFAEISGVGWGWAGIAWVWSLVWYAPLELVNWLWTKLVTSWSSLFATGTRSGAYDIRPTLHTLAPVNSEATVPRRASIGVRGLDPFNHHGGMKHRRVAPQVDVQRVVGSEHVVVSVGS